AKNTRARGANEKRVSQKNIGGRGSILRTARRTRRARPRGRIRRRKAEHGPQSMRASGLRALPTRRIRVTLSQIPSLRALKPLVRSTAPQTRIRPYQSGEKLFSEFGARTNTISGHDCRVWQLSRTRRIVPSYRRRQEWR